MDDLINQGMRAEDARARKRLSIAKNMATLLEVTGLDSMTLNVNGFKLKSERQHYDDSVTKPSVESPPGMYLLVSHDGGFTAHSSESFDSGAAPMGQVVNWATGVPDAFYVEPANMQIFSFAGEMTFSAYVAKMAPGGVNQYQLTMQSMSPV